MKNKDIVARAKLYLTCHDEGTVHSIKSILEGYLKNWQTDGLCCHFYDYPKFIEVIFRGNSFPFETSHINYFCEIDFRNNPKRRDFILKVLDIIKQLENQNEH